MGQSFRRLSSGTSLARGTLRNTFTASYRHALVPGLRATTDAERLASALAWADARLEFPGPHPAVAEEPVQEEAYWLAFLLALVRRRRTRAARGDRRLAPGWASTDALPRSPAPIRARSPPTALGPSAPARRPRRSSASRPGRPSAASAARSSGSRCPARPHRPLRAAQHARRRRHLPRSPPTPPPRQEPTTPPRSPPSVLVSGDAMLLERRAADLARRPASASARDRALAVWGEGEAPEGEAPPAIRSALGLASVEILELDLGARASPRRSSRSSARPTASRPTCSARARCPC